MNDIQAKHLSPELLSVYLDGELPPSEAGLAAAHLQACRMCRDALERLAGVGAALSRLEDVPLERDLAPQVLAALPAARPRWGWALGLAGALQAAAVLAAALLVAAGAWQIPGLGEILPWDAPRFSWQIPPPLPDAAAFTSWLAESAAGLTEAWNGFLSGLASFSSPAAGVSPGWLLAALLAGGAVWAWLNVSLAGQRPRSSARRKP
jgi:hypothetical protein